MERKFKFYASFNSFAITDKDLELVHKQCELQSAMSEDEIEGFTTAYKKAKKFAFNRERETITPDDILSLIRELGVITDEKKNKNGFRRVPVTFASGNQAVIPENVERAMKSWAEYYSEGRSTPDHLYKEFEEIHPFTDGNGRVGDLLWKIATKRVTGCWPEELPPDVYGNEKNVEKYQSTFGDLEE